MISLRYHPSPNYNSRRATTLTPANQIDMLVLHYTGMRTARAALDRMCDPDAQVSAHYMVTEAGQIFQLVPDPYRAWHAGSGFWRQETDINSRSIGIEIVNPGHEFGYHPFPLRQMEAVRNLCALLLHRYPIPAHHVIAHSDLAPDRKQDPGELFDWAFLARAGIGHWITPPCPAPTPPSPATQHQFDLAHFYLRRLGYGIQGDDVVKADFSQVLRAFQRRFAPDFLGLPLCSAQISLMKSYNYL